ncbi:MAG: ATP-binding protein [Pikeienuella sp.]
MIGVSDGQARLSRRIGDSLSEIAEAAADAEALCGASGADESQALRIGLALDELAANALVHGGAPAGGPDIVIELWIDERDLSLRVSARGRRFDPLAPRDKGPEEYAIGGRGLAMVIAFADELSYRREEGRNITTFTVRKFASPKLESGDDAA